MVDANHKRQLEHVARDVVGIVRRRPGRLAALTVHAPPVVASAEVIYFLGQRLAHSGIDFVDITVARRVGPCELQSTEFER